MPPHVERLSIGQIQEAIEFGRKKHQPVIETTGSDDDLKVWDGHKEF
jgi:desulfoferrodoxin (superoxide reductase-like protein)